MSKSRTRRESGGKPTKRASLATTIVVLVLVVGYVALRPVVEQRFGIRLPSIGQQDDTSPDDASRSQRPNDGYGESTRAESPQLDVLRDVGGGVKESPAGLRYGPGSREGHRWKHVLRHAANQPNRPGPHGVFDDDPAQIVAVIDEAYELAEQGSRRARQKRDGPRTIYTVDMGRRVGYVGGQTGSRQGHPPAHGVRLVLEGRNVISAYPVKP
ncbi:MAG: hypothetical protein OES79_15685 [Planctomycetota bacterium]|nr:hypothetical protein [Planctomycetota bacterium]